MDQYKNIKGGDELQKFLSSLPEKLEKNIMRGALRAGAKPIAEEAKQNVPKQSGALHDSIRISTRAKAGQVTASVKAGDKKAWYWRFVEFGTAMHAILPKNAKSFFFGGLFVEKIDHAGARAKPFMRPALDSKWQAAIESAGLYIGKRLTKEGLNNAPGLEVGDE